MTEETTETNVADIFVDVTDEWLDGAADAAPVTIHELRGDPVFMLVPSDETERVDLARAHGYCQECDGRGYHVHPWARQLRSVDCPRCRGKSKALDHPSIRLVMLEAYCKSWSGWTTKQGTEIKDTPELRSKIARDDIVYALIMGHSQTLKRTITDAVQGNGRPGRATSSEASRVQDTDGRGSDESSRPGASSTARSAPASEE